MDAGRVLAIDCIPSRLELARRQGAEAIDFSEDDPVDAVMRLTEGIGVDRVIDAVGVDAVRPHRGPAARKSKKQRKQFEEELAEVAPEQNPEGDNWHPGDAPSQALRWAVEAVAKAGTLSIIGVYGEERTFPIGAAMEKNLTIKMGNCNHRKYIPRLLQLVRSGVIDPTVVLSHERPLESAIDAYKAFDKREEGWIKVALDAALGGDLH
jgi:threonine dehydrogenase-like Zn-dependent dehydrogenase